MIRTLTYLNLGQYFLRVLMNKRVSVNVFCKGITTKSFIFVLLSIFSNRALADQCLTATQIQARCNQFASYLSSYQTNTTSSVVLTQWNMSTNGSYYQSTVFTQPSSFYFSLYANHANPAYSQCIAQKCIHEITANTSPSSNGSQ